jgi:pyruvate dehydrogenase E2 component (dihydrolipoamide acetyltransferase)
LARRLAAEAGLDLKAIKGSGPHGRIVKADLAARAAAPRREVAVAARPPAVVPAGGVYTDIPHSNIRRIIAKRLVEAKQTIPHFYLTIDCELDRLLDLRKELNAKSDAYKLSINDFIIRALALSLRRVPEANAVWMEEALRQFANVDVSVAVAIEGGLVTPVIRDADQKGLSTISNEMKQLTERARAKPMGLKPEEYQGGTTSVSNLGMYGIREFAGVINPPQATLLAVGEGALRPLVKNGALSLATVMTCTLSCDHRVVDGALGARLLQVFKGFIEDPVTMLL